MEHKWKKRDGKLISTSEMSHPHLTNALKMLVRLWMQSGNSIKDLKKNKNFKVLEEEAKRRRYLITYFDEPFMSNGKESWIEIYNPGAEAQISSNFFPTDLDSRQWS